MEKLEFISRNGVNLIAHFEGIECYIEASHGANGEITYKGNRVISAIRGGRSRLNSNLKLLDILFQEGDHYTLPIDTVIPKRIDDQTIEFRSTLGIDYLLIKKL